MKASSIQIIPIAYRWKEFNWYKFLNSVLSFIVEPFQFNALACIRVIVGFGVLIEGFGYMVLPFEVFF